MSKTENKAHTPTLDKILNRISPATKAKIGDRMLIAARIDDLLAQKGWSKKLLAEKLQKEPSVISKWLSGTHNFTTETLTEIRMAFGVSLAELVSEQPQALAFKASFAVTGLGGTGDRRFYGGGEATPIHGAMVQSSIRPLDRGEPIVGAYYPAATLAQPSFQGHIDWIKTVISFDQDITIAGIKSQPDKDHEKKISERALLKA